MTTKGTNRGFYSAFNQLRYGHNVPASKGLHVMFEGRQATIHAAHGEHYVEIILEDRIDKAKIRVHVKTLTFDQEHKPSPEPLTKKALNRKNKKIKTQPDAYEIGWW